MKKIAVVVVAMLVTKVAFADDRSAAMRFEDSFSNSGIFNCHGRLGKIGVDITYAGKYPAGWDSFKEKYPDLNPKNTMGLYLDRYPSKGNPYMSIGRAIFSDMDKSVELEFPDGRSARFQRFTDAPNWPFKDKKDRKDFFTLTIDNKDAYQCRAVYQPDQ